MTDSYHFESVPKFRVGGVYRQKNGVFVGLRDDMHSPKPGLAWVHRIGSDLGEGFRCLTTGVDSIQLEGDLRDLIPGELIQRDGEWVAADSIGPFPSGATLTTSGDKIVGRVEAQPESEVERAVRTILNSPMKRRDNLPPAPLPHFNQRTPFDNFGPEFKVYSDPVSSGFAATAPLHTSPTTDSAYPAIAGLLRG